MRCMWDFLMRTDKEAGELLNTERVHGLPISDDTKEERFVPPVNTAQNATELERLLFALSARTQVEAAEILEIRQSALSDCERRGGIVTGKLLEQAVRAGVSRDWIKEGKTPKMQEILPPTSKCSLGRYCLEVCPAMEAVQQALRLINRCPHICRGCEHKEEKF